MATITNTNIGMKIKKYTLQELKNAIQCIMENNPYIQPSLIPALKSRLVVRDIDKEKLEILED